MTLEKKKAELDPQIEPLIHAIISLFRKNDVHPWVAQMAMIELLASTMLNEEMAKTTLSILAAKTKFALEAGKELDESVKH